MPTAPEEREFKLDYYGARIVLTLLIYRTPGTTALVVATPQGDESGYLEHTGVSATYACAVFRLDWRHVIWVERKAGQAPGEDQYTLVNFDRGISLTAGGTPQVDLCNPVRTPLAPDQLRLIQSRLGEGGTET